MDEWKCETLELGEGKYTRCDKMVKYNKKNIPSGCKTRTLLDNKIIRECEYIETYCSRKGRCIQHIKRIEIIVTDRNDLNKYT